MSGDVTSDLIEYWQPGPNMTPLGLLSNSTLDVTSVFRSTIIYWKETATEAGTTESVVNGCGWWYLLLLNRENTNHSSHSKSAFVGKRAVSGRLGIFPCWKMSSTAIWHCLTPVLKNAELFKTSWKNRQYILTAIQFWRTLCTLGAFHVCTTCASSSIYTSIV